MLYFLILINVFNFPIIINGENKLCIITQNNTGSPLPDLPDQFQTIIEHNYKSYDFNNNYTEEYEGVVYVVLFKINFRIKCFFFCLKNIMI